MSVFKLWLCDIREGIFKNKRYTIVPFICIFECMYAHMSINSYQLYYDVHSRCRCRQPARCQTPRR